MKDNSSFSGRNLIGGEWVAASPVTFRATNPATGKTLPGAFHHATSEEIDRAFELALDAHNETRDLPRERWAELLERIGDEIIAVGPALLERAEAETALPAATRLAGERARTVNQLKLFATLVSEGSWVDAVIDRADPERKPLPQPDVRRMLRPIGPVVVMAPCNFPLAFGICGGDTASALAAGNPVLAKGHSNYPGTNELVARAVRAALEETNFPQGLFALLVGPGAEVGMAMVKHPAAQAAGFTGSLATGRALLETAMSRDRPIPVYAEMGSLNPVVILPGAIRERGNAIAEGLADSVTLGAGQFCTKPGMVLVMDDAGGDGLVAKLAAALAAKDPFTLLTKGIQRSFGKATSDFVDTGGAGVRVAGGCDGHAGAKACLYEVAAADWRAKDTLQHEAFGPATMVVRCKDVADVVATIETVGGSLTGTIHTGDSDDADTIAQIASALERISGRLIYNGFPTGVEVCHAMVHGGPYPAMTFANYTSVGTAALRRFARPVCYQNTLDAMLPPALQDANPFRIMRIVDGEYTRESI